MRKTQLLSHCPPTGSYFGDQKLLSTSFPVPCKLSKINSNHLQADGCVGAMGARGKILKYVYVNIDINSLLCDFCIFVSFVLFDSEVADSSL